LNIGKVLIPIAIRSIFYDYIQDCRRIANRKNWCQDICSSIHLQRHVGGAVRANSPNIFGRQGLASANIEQATGQTAIPEFSA
jgi:hypothetical protein